VALHGYAHKDDYKKLPEKIAHRYIKKSKFILENIIHKKVVGFRAPNMRLKSLNLLDNLDMMYDSSIHPTWIPGRYNNFFKRRGTYIENRILEIPVSTVPVFRIPFSYVWFKIFGLRYAKSCTKVALSSSDYIDIYFHSFDFEDINEANVPFDLKVGNHLMESRLEQYILWCKSQGLQSITMQQFSIEERTKKHEVSRQTPS